MKVKIETVHFGGPANPVAVTSRSLEARDGISLTLESKKFKTLRTLTITSVGKNFIVVAPATPSDSSVALHLKGSEETRGYTLNKSEPGWSRRIEVGQSLIVRELGVSGGGVQWVVAPEP